MLGGTDFLMQKVNPPKTHKTIRKKCIHCGQLILRKISKIGATRSQILRLKCNKSDFHWGSEADQTGGAYSSPPDLLTVFKGPNSKGREGEVRREKG